MKKKIILKSLALLFFLNPIILISRDPIPDFENKICRTGLLLNCQNPNLCSSPNNLIDQLCPLEGDARNILNNYKNLNSAYMDFENLSQNNLLNKFMFADAPKNMAINVLTKKFELKQQEQDYLELDNFKTIFPNNKIDCLTLKEQIEELKTQENFKITNLDEMYSIIWNQSCSIFDLEELSKQSKYVADIIEKLMNEVSRQRINIYNKVVVDSQGKPILQNNKLQYVYDPSIDSIASNKVEILVGPNNVKMFFVTNVDFLNIKKVKDYLDYLFCLLKFKAEYCVSDEKEKSELKSEIKKIEDQRVIQDKTERENKENIENNSKFCGGKLLVACIAIPAIAVGVGTLVYFLRQDRAAKIARESKVANAEFLNFKGKFLETVVARVNNANIKGLEVSSSKLESLFNFAKIEDMQFLQSLGHLSADRDVLENLVKMTKENRPVSEIADYLKFNKENPAELEALEGILKNLRKIVK